MAKLPKFTLSYNDQKERWDLKNDQAGKTLKSYGKKADATKRGVLERAVG